MVSDRTVYLSERCVERRPGPARCETPPGRARARLSSPARPRASKPAFPDSGERDSGERDSVDRESGEARRGLLENDHSWDAPLLIETRKKPPHPFRVRG